MTFDWLAGVVFAVVAILGLRLMLVLPTVLAIRIRPIRLEIVEESAFSQEVREWLTTTAAALEPEGFRREAFMWLHDEDGSTTPVLSMVHTDSGARARVAPAVDADYRLPWRCDLETPISGGRMLVTRNAAAYAAIGEARYLIVHDEQVTNLRELWRTHREHAESAGPTRTTSVEEHIRAVEDASREVVTRVVRSSPEPDASLLTWSAAISLSWRATRGAARRERLRMRIAGEAAAQGVVLPALPRWIELWSFKLTREARARTPSTKDRAALMLASAAVFLGGMALWLGVASAVALLAVVAFHECGHFAAMRALGYRDTSIFFIPFFGGAATGRREDVSIWREMAVLLAGPLPGVALAAGLAMADFAQQAGALVQYLAVINVLNLLPIYPLDGGKLVDRALGAPLASALFGAASCIVLFAAGVGVGDFVLAAFAVLLARGALPRFRAMRVLAQVRERSPNARGDELVLALHDALGGPAPLRFAQRVGALQLAELFAHYRPATRLARGGSLSVYGVVLCLSLLVAGWTLQSRDESAPYATHEQMISLAGADAVSCENPRVPSGAMERDSRFASYATFSCEGNAEAVFALHSLLNAFEEASDAGACIREPWRLSELAPDERARLDRTRRDHARLSELAAVWWSERDVEDEEVEMLDLATSLRRGAAADGLDPRLAELYAETQIAPSDVAARKLEATLGGCGPTVDREWVWALEASPSSLTFSTLARRPESAFPVIARFLCQAGCSVRARVGRNRAALDDE